MKGPNKSNLSCKNGKIENWLISINLGNTFEFARGS